VFGIDRCSAYTGYFNKDDRSYNGTLSLHEKAITTDVIMDVFLQETLSPRDHQPRIFHIDISHEVYIQC
jgi:hypothetical protein